MLPKRMVDVLRSLRAESHTRVLLYRSREEIDRYRFQKGADDYSNIPAPETFSANSSHPSTPSKQLNRRPYLSQRGTTLSWATSKWLGTRKVRAGGSLVVLTAVEFNLLEMLLRSAGQVVIGTSSKFILGRNLSASDRSTDVHVSS